MPHSESMNEAALLQASVGKGRVTLEETTAGSIDDADPSDAKAAATPSVDTVSSRVDTVNLVVQPVVDAAPPQGIEADVAKPLDPEGPEEVGLLQHLAETSVLSIAQRVAHTIRKEIPDGVVSIFPSLKTDLGAAFGLSLASFFIWCTFVAAFASVYRSQKSFPQAVSSRPEQDFNDWTSGPFDFVADWSVCCWSCWCPCIRWADNMDMLGILSFWVGLLVFCGLVLLGTVPGGLLFWLVASLLWMSFRQQLRVKFDMEQNNLRTFAGDCLLYCCCWPCAISQEARHIEEACRAAHKACRKSEPV